MSFWAVAQVQPYLMRVPSQSADKTRTRAEILFAGIGFETYLPKIRVGPSQQIAPLFPNYIFVRVVDCWHVIMWTSGVIHLIMDHDRPARLADRIVNDLRGIERRGVVRLAPPLRGSRVIVTSGPFAGHLGLYDGQGPRDRERVLLELLGQAVPIYLDRALFEPLANQP